VNKFSRWMAAHPVSAYFSLVFLFSWPLFVLVLWIFPQNAALQGTLGVLAAFSPAVSSMVVAAVAEPQRVRKRPGAQWTAFLLTWIVSCTILVLFAARHA
jgi:hypothetical protein